MDNPENSGDPELKKLQARYLEIYGGLKVDLDAMSPDLRKKDFGERTAREGEIAQLLTIAEMNIGELSEREMNADDLRQLGEALGRLRAEIAEL